MRAGNALRVPLIISPPPRWGSWVPRTCELLRTSVTSLFRNPFLSKCLVPAFSPGTRSAGPAGPWGLHCHSAARREGCRPGGTKAGLRLRPEDRRMLREDFLEEVTLESSPGGPGAAAKEDRSSKSSTLEALSTP